MPQLRTKLSDRMANKCRANEREFLTAFAEISQMVDVLFIGCDGEYLGEVVAKASPAGREAVRKLFPDCHTEWRDLGPDTAIFPDDWREFTFVVRGLTQELPALGSKHSLPQNLIDLLPIEDISPDQWAVLMAIGAMNQGARAAFWSISQNKVEILSGPRTFN
jgi:hypothetical protein